MPARRLLYLTFPYLFSALADSTQHRFRSPPYTLSTSMSVSNGIELSTNWTVLGPFPAGMRELPFGGFPASVGGSYAELFSNGSPVDTTFFSTYGPINGTTSRKNFLAEIQSETATHARHLLAVDYPNVDWAGVRKSAGWSALQWQFVAMTDLNIRQDGSALAVTMDKGSEFALVPSSQFHGLSADQEAIRWYNGDWYSYIAAFSSEANDTNQQSISHHLIHTQAGPYKLLLRGMYEMRIFGDPQSASPNIKVGIDMAITSPMGNNTNVDRSVEVHTDAYHSSVPHVVGGWLAGYGASFALRNVHSSVTFKIGSIQAVGNQSLLYQPSLGQELYLSPAQTLLIPVKIDQFAKFEPPLASANLNARSLPFVDALRLLVELVPTASDLADQKFIKSVRLPLIYRPAFWDSSSNDTEHNSFIFTHLAADGTVQYAAAAPPKRLFIESRRSNSSLPPVILTHHGAGVDLRDLYFSNAIRKQSESWVILPSGRSPWGYDWQLASLQAASAAVNSFHENLYGLPKACTNKTTCPMSESDRAKWTFDPNKILVMGHSNGGQGAWYRLGRFPDLAMGGVVEAAYTKVADYVSFAWKAGRHFTDPYLGGLLHTSLTQFENDLFASNMVGLDLLVKYGSVDANVPPWNSRDMTMLIDGWNKRSSIKGKVKLSEVPGKFHWWDTAFSEDDVQDLLDRRCLEKNNPGYKMPTIPDTFTLSVANPSEAGSKGGWMITEVEMPGRMAKLEVNLESGATFKVNVRNARQVSFDLTKMQRYPSLLNVTTSSLSFYLNGNLVETATDEQSGYVRFETQAYGTWVQSSATSDVESDSRKPRPLGPMLRIVSSEGPIMIVLPTRGTQEEGQSFLSMARRFADDLLLYGGINSQFVSDADFVAQVQSDPSPKGNVVSLGGPNINAFTAYLMASWPTQAPFQFGDNTSQFSVLDRPFYSNDTALLALAPHPTNSNGLAMIVHGIGQNGIERAARLLPTRTVTMIPEWIVVDGSSEWMGEGGVKAAGWYDRKWGWSEGMSYLE